MSLTEFTIKNLKPKEKLYRVADSDGLCIEITPLGSKLWRWRYNFQGKSQMLALGKYPAVSLAQARKLCNDAREKAKAGKHLTREKNAEKLRHSQEGLNTFKKIAVEWHDIKSIGLNKKYADQRLALLERWVFPKIGALPVTEITIPDVVYIVETLGKRNTIVTAKRVKQVISQIFRYAAQRGLCSQNPAGDLRDILPKRDRKHHACIHPNQFPALLKAIDNRKKDMSRYAMELLALTFVRTNELFAAEWKEIDWKIKEWHIPKERMKMRRPHIVPLSDQVITILKELKGITGDTPFIFYSSKSKSRHISNTTVLMALRRMNYPGIMTGHGFRTLASTILNEKAYPPDVIEKQLAHDDNDKIRSAYNRAEYLNERKKMMQDYADFLDELRCIEVDNFCNKV